MPRLMLKAQPQEITKLHGKPEAYRYVLRQSRARYRRRSDSKTKASREWIESISREAGQGEQQIF